MWILIIILIILLFIEYFVFKHDILSLSLIVTFMFFLSTFMLLFYARRWGMVWNGKTSILIIVGLLSMIFGEYIARNTFSSKRNLSNTKISFGLLAIGGREKFFENKIEIKLFFLILFNLINFIALVIYYRETISLSSSYSGIETLVVAQINQIKSTGDNVGYFAQQLLTFSHGIALVFSYVVIFNFGKSEKTKFKILYILPIVFYLIVALLTSSRAMLLNFIIYIFIIWLLLYQRKNKFLKKGNKKIFIRGILLTIIIITVFYYAGILTGKSLHYESLSDNLANYFCSSIYGLNSYLTNPNDFSNATYFGIHTFSGVYSTLRTLGMDIPSSIIAYEYIPCGYIVTNIYTAFRRYFQDFNWIGMSFILFCLSYFYTKIICNNRLKNFSGLRTILTGLIFYPLVFMSIEERFFMNVLSVSTIYLIIYIVIIYMVLVYPQAKITNSKLDDRRSDSC